MHLSKVFIMNSISPLIAPTHPTLVVLNNSKLWKFLCTFFTMMKNRKLVHLLSSLYMETVHYFHTKIYKTFPTTPNRQDCIHRIFDPPSIATFSITPMWNYLSFDNKWWWVPTRALEQNSTGTKISMVSSDMVCKYHVALESVSTVFTWCITEGSLLALDSLGLCINNITRQITSNINHIIKS